MIAVSVASRPFGSGVTRNEICVTPARAISQVS
jgi:hypothetical protein